MSNIDLWEELYPSLKISPTQRIFWLDSIEALPLSYWKKQTDVLHSKLWYQALERSSLEELDVGHLVIVTEGKITAHCMIQLVALPFSALNNYLPLWLLSILRKVPHFTASRSGQPKINAMIAGDLLITASSKTDQLPLLLEGLEWLESWMSEERGTFLQI